MNLEKVTVNCHIKGNVLLVTSFGLVELVVSFHIYKYKCLF